MIGIETLKLKEQPSFDLIIVPYKTYILISDKLKDILESAGLAGLSITFFEDIKITTPN